MFIYKKKSEIEGHKKKKNCMLNNDNTKIIKSETSNH